MRISGTTELIAHIGFPTRGFKSPLIYNPYFASAGIDVDVTPRLKAIFTASDIRLDSPAPIEALLFQSGIHRHLGIDVSAGARYRRADRATAGDEP